MSKEDYTKRRQALKQLLIEQKLDAILISLDASRYYLSGFELHDGQINESSGRLIISAQGADWLCTDSRFYEEAKGLWDEEYIYIYKHPAQEINSLLRKIRTDKSPRVGFEAQALSVSFFAAIKDGIGFVPADELVQSLRLKKDTSEIEKLRKACALNHKLMEWLPSTLHIGKKEAEIAWEIEQFFKNNGAEELSFPSIVAINENAAKPHAIPGEKRLENNSCVLIDVGCRLDGYCSDQTRTFWIGTDAPKQFLEDLAQVKEAQKRAIEAVEPGMSCAQLYSIARDHLGKKNLAELFTHGLGHGIGIQTHEAPSLGPNSPHILEAGNLITIEPGVYRAGAYGIRWEHMVLVTENGYEVL